MGNCGKKGKGLVKGMNGPWTWTSTEWGLTVGVVGGGGGCWVEESKGGKIGTTGINKNKK